METSLGQMDGRTWEAYCHKLLKIKYKNSDYHEVPAQFDGDLGIEGFTREGRVFQCYCPEEELTGTELYEAQRDKITRDINKLLKNAEQISRLGAGVIGEWHFLSPRYNNKALLAHCRKKEMEVISKKLKTIHEGFTISLKTDDDFIPERQLYLGTGEHLVHPIADAVECATLDEFMSSDNEIVDNIRRKLERLDLVDPRRSNLIEALVKAYVIGQHELGNLYEKFPSVHKKVVQLKDAVEAQLALWAAGHSEAEGSLLRQTLQQYEAELTKDFASSLNSAMIKRLGMEAISDWLGRCPLDFQDSEGQE